VLILPQAPKKVLNWADTIAQWNFQQIISCHFDSPFITSPAQFRQAFTFLEKNSVDSDNQALLVEDLQFIKELEANLLKQGIATPPREKV